MPPEADATPVTPELTPHEAAMVKVVDDKAASLPTAATETPPATQEVPAEKPPEAPATETPPATPEVPGVDVAKLQAEFTEKGALSEDSYAALQKAGISKDVVDIYIAGQAALLNQVAEQAYALVGGKEQYQAMASWAATALPADAQAAFDKAVSSGTPAERQLAIQGLRAQYEATYGRAPTLTAGGAGGGVIGEAPFASRAEVTKAMADPRYSKDPAYRASVERRLDAMSSF